MIKNPYFHPKSEEISQKEEFKSYPVQENAQPSISPEGKEGLTSIIIPVFLSSYPVFHYTGHTIGSIREHTDKEKTPYEIIMVQNGARGQEKVVEEFVEQTFKNTYCDKVIPNEKNLGYAKAVNQGIRIASGQFIAILNNDICVYTHWLEDMQEALKYVDLVNAMPMYGMPFARAVEAAGFRELMIANEKIKGTIEDSLTEDLGARDFSCVLTTKQLFSHVGLFNEEFFMYGEDIDLIHRIQKFGGKVAATKRVRTFHISGGTASGIKETPDIMNESHAILKRLEKERNL